MKLRARKAATCALICAPVFLLTSCSVGPVATQVTVQPSVQPSLGGKLFGGEQPITGAQVYLFKVNTTTTGGASTNILTTTVSTSDGSGNATNANANAGNNFNSLPAGYFTITGDYTCPTSGTLVYIAGVGGNSGAGVNTAQESLEALGTCGNLLTTPSLVINEVTTVGTVLALQKYMTAWNAVGSTSSSKLTTAFSTAAKYFNLATGNAPGPNLPTANDASDYDVRALANVIQTCVNSTGGTGTGTRCGTLFGLAQGSASSVPTDTTGALLDIFASPTNNTVAIFNDQGSTPAFGPIYATPPTDWTLPIVIAPVTPTISPSGGSFTSVQNITISDSNTDASAAIYYTTDGSTPNAGSTLYTAPITVGVTTTVNSVQITNGRILSPVASQTYTLTGNFTAPTTSLSSISLNFGSTTRTTVTATSNNEGSTVYFNTANGVDSGFSPNTCVISSGSCTANYYPSGTLAVGTYTGGLTASFSGSGNFLAGNSTATLYITPNYSVAGVLSFSGSSGVAPGAAPQAPLIQGRDGYFYGTTYSGGAGSSYGAVFKVAADGSGYTVLHTFNLTSNDGFYPEASVVQGFDGYLYGTTYQGGMYNYGTIYRIAIDGSGYAVLYSFAGGTADGYYPEGALTQTSDGTFYGTTAGGGMYSQGTVFSLNAGTETLVASVGNGTGDARNPYSTLLLGADGYLYGTSYHVVSPSLTGGTLFKVLPSGGGYTVLHDFAGGSSDGMTPYAPVIQGADGALYGTATLGGSSNLGVAYKINADGSGFTLLHSFGSVVTDGRTPNDVLVLGSDGKLYGTTYNGGSSNSYGTAYSITADGGSYNVVHVFSNGTDGKYPYAGLVQGSDGNFYSTTTSGGTYTSPGVVYALKSSPALSAPITLSVPSSVSAGSTFTFHFTVANAYSTTLHQCQYFATNSSGTVVSTGSLTGSPSNSSTTLTAPSTTGTYTYALTCGGMETSTVPLTVQ